MKKRLLTLLISLCLLMDLCPISAAPYAAGEEEATPLIYLSNVPAYGEATPCVGAVLMPDGTAPEDLDSYRIAMYIRIGDASYDQYWIKPSSSQPVTRLNSVGGFRSKYYTSTVGNDLNARYIHILLIPADYTPDTNGYRAAKEIALDEVTIIRETDGSITVPRERLLKEQPQEHSRRAALSVSSRSLALNMGFYNTGAPNADVSLSAMRTQLTAIRPFSDTVRFYSASGTAYKAYALAHGMGFRIIGNAWLSGSEEADRAELDALIEHANNGYLSLAVVGSETQYRRLYGGGSSVPLDTLIEDIEYVRARIPESIPVTTADTLGILLNDLPELADACDMLFVNTYPIWDDSLRTQPMETCVAALADQVNDLKTAYGKQVIVSETGWATDGTETSPARAAEYYALLREWEKSSGTLICYFEAFDEPWKVEGKNGYGPNWGFLDRLLTIKPAFSMLEPFLSAGLGQGIPCLPTGCTTLDAEALADCTGIDMLYVPANVSSIADDALSGCTGLTIIADSERSYAYRWAQAHDFPVVLRWW